MRRAALAIAFVSIVALGAPSGAHAAAAVEGAGPGAEALGYTSPILVTKPGASITFVNGDNLASGGGHDFVAFQVYGPDDQFWCEGSRTGRCPLFWTPLIPFATATPVFGLENVVAGKAYPFYCSIHPGMRGTLIVL